MSELRRALSIITNECHNLNIKDEYIEWGRDHARQVFDARGNFTSSILAGVAVAERRQLRDNH